MLVLCGQDRPAEPRYHAREKRAYLQKNSSTIAFLSYKFNFVSLFYYTRYIYLTCTFIYVECIFTSCIIDLFFFTRLKKSLSSCCICLINFYASFDDAFRPLLFLQKYALKKFDPFRHANFRLHLHARNNN